MARVVTLRRLAVEAGLDLDEALLAVWDEGYETFDDIDDIVPHRLVPAVRRVLGLASPKEMQNLSFWAAKWGLDRAGLVLRLSSEFGITVSGGARVLPKGALRRLRRNGYARVPRQHDAQQVAKAEAPRGPVEWNPPGRPREVAPVTVEEICQVHEALAKDFGASGDPIDPPGVRDANLLHSAASRPETSLGGIRKYDTVEVYAAALLHSLVHNHPFHNGNKRTALVSMLVLLDRNNVLLTCSERALFRHVLRVAQHRIVPPQSRDRADREVLGIAEWICSNCRGIHKGERVLKWRDLRKVLTQFDCDVSSPLPGNKVKIERTVQERRIGIKRDRRLRVTAGYRNEGSEVDTSQLNYIRRELHLDESHGCDADYFYRTDPREPDEFIAEYRTLLRRLGRL